MNCPHFFGSSTNLAPKTDTEEASFQLALLLLADEAESDLVVVPLHTTKSSASR